MIPCRPGLDLELDISVETESDLGSVDSDQIPLFQGFGIDSNLFFKIRIWDSSMIHMILQNLYEVLLKNGKIRKENFGIW